MPNFSQADTETNQELEEAIKQKILEDGSSDWFNHLVDLLLEGIEQRQKVHSFESSYNRPFSTVGEQANLSLLLEQTVSILDAKLVRRFSFLEVRLIDAINQLERKLFYNYSSNASQQPLPFPTHVSGHPNFPAVELQQIAELKDQLTDFQAEITEALNQLLKQVSANSEAIDTPESRFDEAIGQLSDQSLEDGTSTGSDSSPPRSRKPKRKASQAASSPTPAKIRVKGGYVEIDGVLKKLLVPQEALEIVRRNHPDFEGNAANLRFYSNSKSMKSLRKLGLGAIPKLRGGKGQAKAWYYEL